MSQKKSEHVLSSLFSKKESAFIEKLVGLYVQKMHTPGSEFDALQPFIPGDHPKSLHLRSFLKNGDLIKKQLLSDVSRDVYIYIAGSDSWDFGSQIRTKHETLTEFISLIGGCCDHLGDGFELISGGNSYRATRNKKGDVARILERYITEKNITSNSAELEKMTHLRDKNIFLCVDRDIDIPMNKTIQYLARRNTIFLVYIYDTAETKSSIIPIGRGAYHSAKKLPENMHIHLNERSDIYDELCHFCLQKSTINIRNHHKQLPISSK